MAIGGGAWLEATYRRWQQTFFDVLLQVGWHEYLLSEHCRALLMHRVADNPHAAGRNYGQYCCACAPAAANANPAA